MLASNVKVDRCLTTAVQDVDSAKCKMIVSKPSIPTSLGWKSGRGQ